MSQLGTSFQCLKLFTDKLLQSQGRMSGSRTMKMWLRSISIFAGHLSHKEGKLLVFVPMQLFSHTTKTWVTNPTNSQWKQRTLILPFLGFSSCQNFLFLLFPLKGYSFERQGVYVTMYCVKKNVYFKLMCALFYYDVAMHFTTLKKKTHKKMWGWERKKKEKKWYHNLS